MSDAGFICEHIISFWRLDIPVLILIVAGQFVKHKLPDLLRSYIDAGKSSAFKVAGF